MFLCPVLFWDIGISSTLHISPCFHSLNEKCQKNGRRERETTPCPHVMHGWNEKRQWRVEYCYILLSQKSIIISFFHALWNSTAHLQFLGRNSSKLCCVLFCFMCYVPEDKERYAKAKEDRNRKGGNGVMLVYGFSSSTFSCVSPPKKISTYNHLYLCKHTYMFNSFWIIEIYIMCMYK